MDLHVRRAPGVATERQTPFLEIAGEMGNSQKRLSYKVLPRHELTCLSTSVCRGLTRKPL